MQYVCYQHTQLSYICSWLQADPDVCGIHTCICNFDHWHDGCFHISDTSGLYMPGLHTQPECLQALLCILYTVQVYRMAMDCQHFFRQIFLGYFSDIVQAFDTLRKNVCGDDYTSLHNPIVLSSVLPAYGMFHSIQILFL